MGRCGRYEPSIERLLADEIGAAERDRLLAHAQQCEECRAFVDLHHRLLDHELDDELPDEAQLAGMRSAVLREIRDRSVRRTGAEAFRAVDLMGLLRARPAWSAGLAAALLLAAAVGVAAGRGWERGRPVDLGALLSREARGHAELADVEESPFLYSNVTLRPAADGTVSVSFDVTRHLALRQPKDHPLVKEALIHSLLRPSPVGTKLEAVSLAAGLTDTKVKQVLLMAMLDDPSQAVRTRALELLAGKRDDPEVQAALLSVLRGEDSVHMRLMALDQLVASDLGRERLDALLSDLVGRPEDRALVVRAASYGGGVEPSR